MTARASCSILSPIKHLGFVALWFKSKKRNRKGKCERISRQAICIVRPVGLYDSSIPPRKISAATRRIRDTLYKEVSRSLLIHSTRDFDSKRAHWTYPCAKYRDLDAHRENKFPLDVLNARPAILVGIQLRERDCVKRR